MMAGAVVIAVVAAPLLFAQTDPCEYGLDLTGGELLPYNAVIEDFLTERESETIDEITIGELRELGAQLSVLAQEEDYVRSARQASWFLPGAGHFKIGENGRGAAFMTGSVLVVAGTLVGAYFALPEDVQFGEVDYINDSFHDIGSAWRGESIASMLPAIGILIGGGIVQSILGEVASCDAGRRARAQIESGEKRFEPQPFIFPDAQGRLMLGARIGL